MRRMFLTLTIAVLFLIACGICIHYSIASLEREQRIKEQIAKVQEHTQKLGMHNGVEQRLELRKK